MSDNFSKNRSSFNTKNTKNHSSPAPQNAGLLKSMLQAQAQAQNAPISKISKILKADERKYSQPSDSSSLDIRKKIWEGSITVRFIVSQDEVRDFGSTADFYVRIFVTIFIIIIIIIYNDIKNYGIETSNIYDFQPLLYIYFWFLLSLFLDQCSKSCISSTIYVDCFKIPKK